jgi:hypothetical protein
MSMVPSELMLVRSVKRGDSYHVHASGLTTTIEKSPVDVVGPALPIERETKRLRPGETTPRSESPRTFPAALEGCAAL